MTKRLTAERRKVPVITTVPPILRQQVERLADQQGVSLSEITRRALEQFVADETRKR